MKHPVGLCGAVRLGLFVGFGLCVITPSAAPAAPAGVRSGPRSDAQAPCGACARSVRGAPLQFADTRAAVHANVLASCMIGAKDLDFGEYVAAANVASDVESQILVMCSAGQSFNIALGAGRAPGATVMTRRLTSESSALPYALYTSPGRSTVWGDGSLSSSTVSEIGSGLRQIYTVFGRIEPGQFVTPGEYSDTFSVTLTY